MISPILSSSFCNLKGFFGTSHPHFSHHSILQPCSAEFQSDIRVKVLDWEWGNWGIDLLQTGSSLVVLHPSVCLNLIYSSELLLWGRKKRREHTMCHFKSPNEKQHRNMIDDDRQVGVRKSAWLQNWLDGDYATFVALIKKGENDVLVARQHHKQPQSCVVLGLLLSHKAGCKVAKMAVGQVGRTEVSLRSKSVQILMTWLS